MPNWIDKFFVSHPRTVDETYLEHFVVALSFAFRLGGAALACLIHALVPGLFVKTGSTMINQLYAEMVLNRNKNNPGATPSTMTVAGQETAQ